MRRNLLMDVLLLFVSAGLALTGSLLWQDSRRKRTSFLSRAVTEDRHRQPWLNLHLGLSVSFLLGTVLHLFWHRNWLEEHVPEVLHGGD